MSTEYPDVQAATERAERAEAALHESGRVPTWMVQELVDRAEQAEELLVGAESRNRQLAQEWGETIVRAERAEAEVERLRERLKQEMQQTAKFEMRDLESWKAERALADELGEALVQWSYHIDNEVPKGPAVPQHDEECGVCSAYANWEEARRG